MSTTGWSRFPLRWCACAPPLNAARQISAYSLRVEPKDHFINWQQDPQGNFQARLVFNEPTEIFSVEVDLVAEMTVINPFDFFLEPDAETFPFNYDAALAHELSRFWKPSRPPRC